MRKRLIFVLILVCSFMVSGCSYKKNNSSSTEEYFNRAVLKINMPLNFDDLDSYFELPLSDSLESNDIGSIVGDGTPIGDYGPYATEIEFNISKDKIEKFKELIDEYEFSVGSYLEIDGEEPYKLAKSNSLVGIRLEFKNLDNKEIEKIYSEMSNSEKNYKYKTLIEYSGDTFAFYYSNNIDSLKNSLSKYIEDHNLKNKITISSMPEVIEEAK